MAWPTPQDYNEAIQNPQINFTDPELKAGQPELTPMGLPRPITGAFASVYRMRCGSHDYAVRCFLREYADQQNRYLAIGQHLAGLKIPYTVNFEFLPQGIKVGGKPYPILKMEWVQGASLIEHVQRNLQNSAALLDLANQWAAMIGELQRHNIAHGDLQHGNILVLSDGKLKLIDYDGMFVPALGGQSSHEKGHRNYQLPARTESDFGPYTDNFSAWVIYVSLLALSAEPALWTQFKAGDESLLFSEDDFKHPDTSPLIARLVAHSDARVQALASVFQTLLYFSPRDVPPINASPPELPPPVGEWWKDAGSEPATQRPQPAPAPQPVPVAQQPFSVDWIMDNLGEETFGIVPPFEHSMRMVNLAFIAPIALCLLMVVIAHQMLALLGLPLIVLLGFALAFIVSGSILVWSFNREPAVIALRPIRERERIAVKALDNLNQEIGKTEGQKHQILNDEKQQQDKLQSERAKLERKEHEDLREVQNKLQAQLADINRRRTQLNQLESTTLSKAQSSKNTKVAALDREINAINQSMADEIKRSLDRIQLPFIMNYLQQQRLRDASIPGIGATFKSRLQRAGFNTAADIDFNRVQYVEGIGYSRAASLLAWRNSVEQLARSRMPSQLPPNDENAITAPYNQRRSNLTAQRVAEERNYAAQETTIRADFQNRRAILDSEQKQAQSNAAKAAQNIPPSYKSQYDNLSELGVKCHSDCLAAISPLDSKIADFRKQVFAANWEVTKVRRELTAFQAITIRNYILRALALYKRP